MSVNCTIYFVDSEDETRRTLQTVIQQEHLRVATFSHAKSFLKAFDDGPGCLIAELHIEDMSGLELQKQLAKLESKLPVIFVTAHPETHMIVSAMQNGAITVLQKPVREQELYDAVAKALARDGERHRVDAHHEKQLKRLAGLSSKDKDVLKLILQGIPNKMIAKRLDISLRTVEARRQKVFLKTKCESLAELIKLAIDAGWEFVD